MREIFPQNAVNLWNSLPQDVVKAETTAVFKKELGKFIEDRPIHVHEPGGTGMVALASVCQMLGMGHRGWIT